MTPGGGTFPEASADFRIPADVHYLNCAYMSPLHPEVEAVGVAALGRKRAPWAIGSDAFFTESGLLRSRFAELVGSSDPSRVAILPSVSYGVAIAARNAGEVRGRKIIVLRDQFPGNVYAWKALEEREGARLHFVDPPSPKTGDPGRGEGWNRRILEAIDRDTAVVALAPVHWTDGTRFDLEAIGSRAREVGALFVVDGTQSVGAQPIDLKKLAVDALVVAGYKWLMGPYSVAAGWFGPRFDGGIPLEEGWIAREGSEDFRNLVNYRDGYQPGAIRFDVGERSNFTLVPMMVRALELVLEWTPERIAAHAGALNRFLAHALVERGYRVEEEVWRARHILGVGMPAGVDPGAVRDGLEGAKVFASLRGGALRISPHLYNGQADAEALLAALP